MVPGIVQASHALVLLQKHKTQLETAYADIKAHKRDIGTLEAMAHDYGHRIADLTDTNCEMRVREREAGLEILALKKEASESKAELLACQKDLNISKKQTIEALDGGKNWRDGQDELEVQLGQINAQYLKTTKGTIARVKQPWLEERKVLVERVKPLEAQHVQLRRVKWEECACNGEASTHDEDWVKATEVLRGHFEEQAEILRRRIAFLELKEDVVIEAHPLHQQIKAALMDKFEENFTMQQEAKTIKSQMEGLAEIHRRMKEEWEAKTEALEEELKATKLELAQKKLDWLSGKIDMLD